MTKTITRDDVLNLRSLAPSLADLCDRAIAGQPDAWWIVRDMLRPDVRHCVYVHHHTGDQLLLVADRDNLLDALRTAREYLGGDARAILVSAYAHGVDATLRIWVQRYSGTGEIVEGIAERQYLATHPAPDACDSTEPASTSGTAEHAETRAQAKARRARARRAARRQA